MQHTGRHLRCHMVARLTIRVSTSSGPICPWCPPQFLEHLPAKRTCVVVLTRHPGMDSPLLELVQKILRQPAGKEAATRRHLIRPKSSNSKGVPTWLGCMPAKAMPSTRTPCTGRVMPSTPRPGRWRTDAHQGTSSSATTVSLAVSVYQRTLRTSPFRKRVHRKSIT